MAKKKKKVESEDVSVDEKIKQTRKVLDDAEKRFQALVTKRDELHEEGKLIKEERDDLHQQKRTMADRIKELKEERTSLVEEMRSHKKRRDQAQAEAKRLIARRQGKTQKVYSDLVGQIDDLETELKLMDYQYQTEPLDMKKEKEFLDRFKEKYNKLLELQKLKPDHEVLLGEIDDINERITALFKLADEEHAEVDRLYKKSQGVHDKVLKINDEIKVLAEEANKKHEEFKKLNERATHFHERAMEMRSKILSIRRERREILSEAKKVVDDINLAVKDKLEDEEELEKAADDAVKKLKSKGKIEL